jgi:hypothetical protein
MHISRTVALQALMRRMKQDQAKLQGKLAAVEDDITESPATVDEGVQV